jgi:ABC-2 type transport system permease protein
MRSFSARRAWAVSRKEFLHVIRDARSLGMAVAIPMLMLVLFGYALTLDVDNVPMVVWDQSDTQLSRDFIARFQGSRYFSLRSYARTYAEVEHAIDSGAALVALVVPRDFASLVESGRAASVQMIVDGSDSNTATIAMGYADVVALTFSQDLAVREIGKLGGPSFAVPVDVRPRVWFNSDMESKNYIVPGLTAVIMMVISALLTSLTVAREWERGTMEQLISTPVKGPELVLGKLLPYFAIGMFDMLLAVLMGKFLFHVPLRGSTVLLFAIAAVFLVGILSMGMLVSIVMKSQLLASQIAMVLTFLPSFLLSGFVYPIANMAKPVQWISHLVPARYFVALMRGIYLKGVGLEILAAPAGLLAAFAVVMLVLANVKFKKKLT